MSRRRKHLGSSVMDHRLGVTTYINRASVETKKARIALRVGECLRAGQAIDRAYMMVGAAISQRYGMESQYDEADASISAAHQALKDLDKEFEPACVRRHPVEATSQMSGHRRSRK